MRLHQEQIQQNSNKKINNGMKFVFRFWWKRADKTMRIKKKEASDKMQGSEKEWICVSDEIDVEEIGSELEVMDHDI